MQKYSWKTTTAGVLSLLIAIFGVAQKYLYGQPIQPGDITTLIAGMTVAVGLLTARDNTKTSEDVGADLFSAQREKEASEPSF